MTGYLASVSKDEGHQGGTWTKRAQAGHRESRSGKTQQVWKVKDGTVVEDAATRLPLASAPPGLSVTGDTVAGSGGQLLALLPASTFARDQGVYPGPCRESAPPPRPGPASRLRWRRRACPAGPAFQSGRHDGRRPGRIPRLGPEPGAERGRRLSTGGGRPGGQARAEVLMGKGGGRAIMKGKWWAGGPARAAAAVLTRAGQCG